MNGCLEGLMKGDLVLNSRNKENEDTEPSKTQRSQITRDAQGLVVPVQNSAMCDNLSQKRDNVGNLRLSCIYMLWMCPYYIATPSIPVKRN